MWKFHWQKNHIIIIYIFISKRVLNFLLKCSKKFVEKTEIFEDQSLEVYGEKEKHKTKIGGRNRTNMSLLRQV